jgi:3-oxoacyl-[acyl-carrier protein] reductase
VVTDINPEAAQQTMNDIISMGAESLAVLGDVADLIAVKDVVEKTVRRFGRIDILINNAGIRPLAGILDKTEEEWNRTMGVNLSSQFYFIKEVAPHMLRTGKGKIVNIASIGGIKPFRNRVDYCVSKAGVIMLTKCAALELGPEILVNAIAPGPILTQLTERYLTEDTPDSKAMKAFIEKMPIPKISSPDAIANMALFLSSGDSDFCTGSVFTADGGATL